MKTIILNGSDKNDSTGERISTVLLQNLQTRGWEAEHILVREQKIGNCAGDFFCWTRNPGICNVNDANRVIAAKVVQSDLLIYLTPVTFGGYSSELKRMVDHQIQNILPFFKNVGGEIHHQKRYQKYPRLLVIGWMPSQDVGAEAVFRHLVKRNAINMYAPTSVCGLVVGAPSERGLTSQIDGWLEDIAHGSSSPVPDLPRTRSSTLEMRTVKRALFLAGSPRTRMSTSAALGGYLMDQLTARGVQTETIQIYTSLNSRERIQSMYKAIDAADLIVLAFPLYVDSLPAPVIAALEKIVLYRAGNQTPQCFAAIANCGFPEAGHNATALAICETFARQAGLIWAGSLALGGGEGLVHGTPLEQLDGRAIPLKKSLDLAADALAAGNEIPQVAVDIMAKPVISPWMYLLMGAYGWRQQAKVYGMQNKLKQQPYRIVEGAE